MNFDNPANAFFWALVGSKGKFFNKRFKTAAGFNIFFALLSHKNTKGKVIRISKAIYDTINGVWSCANFKNYSLSKQMVI